MSVTPLLTCVPASRPSRYPLLAMLALLLMLPLRVSAAATPGEILYVHDMLRVDLRAGPTNTHKIIDFIKSGTPLKVVGGSPDGVWYQVEANGKQGWIQGQYLTSERVARDLLTDMQSEKDKLRKQNDVLQEQLSEMREELKNLKTAHRQLNSGSAQLQRELENIQRISKEAISTEASLHQLTERNQLLQTDVEKLNQEISLLQSDNRREGIQWGSLAVVVGVLIALIVPRLGQRRRRNDIW
jgi:SH3 domain protein